MSQGKSSTQMKENKQIILLNACGVDQKLRDYNISITHKHQNTREYFHLEIMNCILDQTEELDQQDQDTKKVLKLPINIRIKAFDIKFNDQYQYLRKYYQRNEALIEIACLLEYYRYYIQIPLINLRQHFGLMFYYNQKKKEIQCKKFKKLLSITHSSMQTNSRKNSTKKGQKEVDQKFSGLENILASINISNNHQEQKNQSYFFMNLQERLVSKYGQTNLKNMNQIDKLYCFNQNNRKQEKKVYKAFQQTHINKNGNRYNFWFKQKETKIMESTNITNSQIIKNQNNYTQKVFNYSKQCKKEGQHSQQKQSRKSRVFQQFVKKNPYRVELKPQIKRDKSNQNNIQKRSLQTRRKLQKKSIDNINLKNFITLADQFLDQNKKNFKFQKQRVQNLNNSIKKTQFKRKTNSCENLQNFKFQKDATDQYKLLSRYQIDVLRKSAILHQNKKSSVQNKKTRLSPSQSYHRKEQKDIIEMINRFKNKIRIDTLQLNKNYVKRNQFNSKFNSGHESKKKIKQPSNCRQYNKRLKKIRQKQTQV